MRADETDKYELYEAAAQSPEQMIRFLHAVHGGAPRILGEDFAGTGAVSKAWAAQDEERRAVAVDHDEEPLRRATAERVAIHRADVMAVDDPVDIIAVLNFSIGECLTRDVLLDYLRHARERLADRSGVLVMDLFGGASLLVHTAIQIDLGNGITYTWENEPVNLMSNEIGCRMSFQFDDGSEMPAAFFYHWRLWSPREIIDAAKEVGFASIDVYDRMGDAVDDEGKLYVVPVTGLYAAVEMGPGGEDEPPDEELTPAWDEDDETPDDADRELGDRLPDWQCFVVARTMVL
ncbi:MAG: hypothetical protein KAS72_14345 [Phycisphaerales bacterium]|nr:hypothetical protein [Phycisphaerales bacterium]